MKIRFHIPHQLNRCRVILLIYTHTHTPHTTHVLARHCGFEVLVLAHLFLTTTDQAQEGSLSAPFFI